MYLYSVERSTRSSKTSDEKQVICNFNKCSFYSMVGPKTWLKFFIDIIFFSKKEHNWAYTTFSKLLDIN